MSKTIELGWDDVRKLIERKLPKKGTFYGVPRGGAIVAWLTGRVAPTPYAADYILDDIVDSGRTKARWRAKHPTKPFVSLLARTDGWVKFPWEDEPDRDVEDNVVRLLEFVGEDPRREGLIDTPKRVVKALKEMTVGYSQDPAKILGTDFDVGRYDEMILVPEIQFFSNCEHHMLPFYGKAWVAYLPNKKSLRVVGLSKIARVVNLFARRLQVQERMTMQIAEAIQTHLKASGVGVVVHAKHHCMCARGVQNPSASMMTSALLGNFKQGTVRSEFLSLVAMSKGGVV